MSLYRKYRPQKFVDLIGEDHIRDTLLLAIKENRIGHGYLFSGPRGTGKTSVARLLAKAANCLERFENGEPCGNCQSCKEIISGKSLDIIEIDAASNRGIDEIRELRDKVKFAPSGGKYKIFIIDEVHMLTLQAFNALLKTLEEPPKHAIFILATTEAHKVPATILSRVQRFDFRRVNKADIIINLKRIAGSENYKFEDAALEAIAVFADGSHRDSISLLEQVASGSKEISFAEVRTVLGLAKGEAVLNLINLIFSAKQKEAISLVDEFILSGVEAGQIISQSIEMLRQLLIFKISSGEAQLELTSEMIAELEKISKTVEAKNINKILSIFIEANQLLKSCPVRSLPIEMAIIESVALIFPSAKTEVFEKAETREKVETKKSQPKPELKTEPKPEVEVKINEVEKEETKEPVQEEPKSNEKQNVLTKEFDAESWKKILELVKAQNHTLHALLRDASPEELSDDKLQISVKFKFHHDKISENANRNIIEQVAENVLGKKCFLKCRIKEKQKTPKIIKSESENEDLEQMAKEVFEVE